MAFMLFLSLHSERKHERRNALKTQSTTLVKMLMVISLVLTSFTSSFSQGKNIHSVKDYTSIAKISSSAEGKTIKYTNPYNNQLAENFAGAFNGTLNSHSEKFYCIDLQHGLVYNQDYWDESSTPSEITYILNNYFPYKTNYDGKLSDNNSEAAAVQMAIWYFSDNVDANTISNSTTVKNRTLAIIADANANHNNVNPLQTLQFIPASQTLQQGETASFQVKAFLLNGNPAAGITIQLSTTLGTLSTSSATTDANGETPVITLSYSGSDIATVKAQADVEIPQGTRYVHKNYPNSKQKLVLATPSFDLKEVTCNIEWEEAECFNTIGDYVWHDKDVDGKQDSNEPGIAGVAVELLFNSNVIATSTTDNNGKYEFTNLSNGTYEVRIASTNYANGGVLESTSQVKWYSTKKNQGNDDSKDSDSDKNESVTVTVNCNNDLTIDFGFYKTCISVIKTADKQTAVPGDIITYTFTVENCGDITLSGGVDFYDTLINPTGDHKIKNVTPVNPGETKSFTKTYTVTSNDCGELFNTVKAVGHPADGSANVEDESSVTTYIDCGLTCVSDWTVELGPDSAICEYEPKNITINGTVHLTPNPSKAYLQLSWRIVEPNDGTYDNSTHYETILITKDTTFSITAFWPGIRPTDEIVEIHYGVNVLDCDGNPIKNGVGRDLYWYPWVCNPPEEKEADVMIEKFSSTENPRCGEEFTYTVKVTNNGPNEAKGIQASDILPTGLVYVSSNASQGTFDNNTGLWAVGNLDNGAYATLSITVTTDCDEFNNSAFDFGPAKDYNLFVILDVTQPSSDTQGKVAVGRNASFGAYSIGDQLPANSGDVLIVGNDLTFTSGAVYNGNVVYGNTTNLPIYAVSITGGTLRQDNPINFAAAKAYLENLSTTLSGYTVNGTTTMQWGGLNLTGTDPFLNVFSINGSDLSSANNMAIDVPNGSVVLVNINGTTVSWIGGLTVTGTAINNVLYNFYEAEQMTIQGIDVKGSILAPFADVNFAAGVQNGQMMCKSLIGIGQFNYAPFNGNIPVEKHITNIATITATITPDPDQTNNSASVQVLVSNTENNNGGNNGNGNWQEVRGFGAGEIVYTMVYSNNAIYAGTWGGKIYKSTNNGQTWTVINKGMNVGFIWSLQISGSYIFAATEAGVYKYDGSSWTITSLTGTDVHALASYNGTIYAGTWGLGVFKSEDNRSTWSPINNGFGFNLLIQSLSVNAAGEIFVGTAGDGLYKSSDNGASFTKLTGGYEFIWALGITSSNTVFAGSYGDGLYSSHDGGATFTKINSLSVPFIYSIVVDASGKIYVTSWASGVYTSTDNGSTWTSMGMGGLGVSSLMVSKNSDNVFVGTKEGKVFVKMSESVTAVEGEEDMPRTFELNQNYPNPFNPSTTIKFAVPEAGSYSLRVYDILGQEVATLINGQLNAGTHNVTFDASRITSGMYIYKLTGDNVNLTKKMLLVK